MCDYLTWDYERLESVLTAVEAEVKAGRLAAAQRRYGEFRRCFSLGPDVDTDAVAAEYKDGVLRIRVPKAEEVRPRRIEVKS